MTFQIVGQTQSSNISEAHSSQTGTPWQKTIKSEDGQVRQSEYHAKMIQCHCYVCQLSTDMNMHVIHHNHIVKYARTYHMMSCIVYHYIYMILYVYVLFYASKQTKKLGRLCMLSTLTPDHQPMVGPWSDLPQPVSFAFRNHQKTCPSWWGHSENPRKSHLHIKSCIHFCSRRNGVNCSWKKIQSPQVEPTTIYQGFMTSIHKVYNGTFPPASFFQSVRIVMVVAWAPTILQWFWWSLAEWGGDFSKSTTSAKSSGIFQHLPHLEGKMEASSIPVARAPVNPPAQGVILAEMAPIGWGSTLLFFKWV